MMKRNTMMESGSVERVEDGIAYVKIKRSSQCGRCKACGMLKDMTEIVIDVPNSIDAKPGDRVAVSFSGKDSLLSSLLAYGFPLVMLFIGVFFGYYILSRWFSAQNADIVAAVTGIIFTAGAFFVIKALEPVLKRKLSGTFALQTIIEKEKE